VAALLQSAREQTPIIKQSKKVVISSLMLGSFHRDKSGDGEDDRRRRLNGFRDKRFGEDKIRACHRDEVVDSALL
jgi:hypothetical protein